MERTPHVMLAGEGALALCRAHGLTFADADWFRTEARWQALEKLRARRSAGLGDGEDQALRHGTVGAVARDRHGHVAAATSTGGMTGKAPGRIGDSPVIGAGTWADDATCAVSATGHGEVFIRYAAAHEIDARMRWGGQTLAQAAEAVVHEVLAPNDGSGGLIAVDAAGNAALPFNCEGMYRGLLCEDGTPRVAIHREPLAPPEG
jgi:isoaspartyl peptidase/L-asparaginase-like protein (Ntn-hydrolase superfamily)